MDTKQLQDLFGEFLQALGLHRPDQVPAGFSISLSEMFALMVLAAGAPMSQQVLAEHLQLEKSTVSRLIKHLEQRGWVLSFVLFTQSRDLSHFILKVTHSLHLCFFTFSAGERNRHQGPILHIN